nr:MAG TPA: Receptor Binding Protein [Caudoviricetes sp.]
MEKFSFFNDVHDDRVYYAEDWARHLKKYFTNGIFNNELNVLANNDMTITIKEGDANIEGYRYTNTGDLVKTIDNADGTLNRIDNVVLRLDLTNRLISAQIIKGTFADKPVAPELVRTSTIYDLRLAKISIPAGTTTITQDLITDTRFITSDCGNVISTVQTPDTENLFIQMQTLFEKQINELNNNFEIWFDSIKNQLDSDAAGNLQNQINNLNSNKVDNAKYDLDSNNLQLLANGKNVGDSVHIPTGITDTATGEEDLKIVNNRGVVKFSLEGKTEQKTSKQSKNLIGLKKGFTQTVNGMTVSVQEDGGLRVTGTPTKISESYIPLEGVSSISNGDYTLSVKTIGSTPSNACRLLKTNLASAANSFKSTALSCQSNTTKSMSATITDEEVYTYFYFYTNANVTIDATIYPQLEKGSTYTEWVEFTPDSPSPDYPQLINNVKGIENIWFGGESTTVNGVTFTKNDDGSYDITGTATASADCINLVNIANAKLKNGINYNLSINKLTNEKVSILTEAYIENWDSHVIGPLITSTTLSTNKIINIKDNITRVRYVIRVEKGQTVNIKGLKIQLEEGSIAHNFVPNGSNYLQLENVGENILNIDETPFTVKKITSQGNVLYWSGYSGVNDFVKVKEKTTYKFSSNEVNKVCYIDYYDKNKNYLSRTGTAVDYFTTPENCKYIKFAINLELIPTNAQLREGTIIKPYEPYKKKIINIDLKGNELCSDKEQTLKDELIIENGRAKIIKKYNKVVLDGTKDIKYYGEYGLHQLFYYDFLDDSNHKNNNKSIALCNQYKCVSDINNTMNAMKNFEMRVREKDGRLYWQDDRYNNISDMKSWLSNNNMIICYELAEPEVVDLGKVDFELLEGNSTLNLEEDLKSNMSIKYYTDSTVVDLKKKVENKQNVILHGTTVPSNDLGEDGDIYLQHN